MGLNGPGVIFGAVDRTSLLPTQNILSSREPVDIKKIARASNMLLVGDDHTQPAIKDFLKNHLEALQGLGFRYLALEMLPSNLQGDLDSWTTSSRRRVGEYLEANWGDKGPGVVDSLVSLIDAAKRCGIKVIALETPRAAEMSRAAVNPYWVERIQSYLSENPAGRMIVFCGSAHLESRPGTLYSILSDRGLTPSVVEFSGVDREKSLREEIEISRILGKPVSLTIQVGLAACYFGIHENFMLSVPNPSKRLAWIVNLTPQSSESPALLARL